MNWGNVVAVVTGQGAASGMPVQGWLPEEILHRLDDAGLLDFATE